MKPKTFLHYPADPYMSPDFLGTIRNPSMVPGKPESLLYLKKLLILKWLGRIIPKFGGGSRL
jgi:hypothetical protein